MNARLRDVLKALPDAQALTAEIQRGRDVEERRGRRAVAAATYHKYRHDNPVRENIRSRSKNGGAVSLAIEKIFRETRECAYCHRALTEERVTIDHVIPLTRGGRHEAENLVGCCRRCNGSKGNKLNWRPRPEWICQTPDRSVLELE